MTLIGRWGRATDWLMTAAAFAFLTAYAVPILEPDLGPGLVRLCRFVVWATWALFALDYVTRLVTAANRKQFFLRHLLDLAIIALPLLRPLRLLRLASLLTVVNRKAAAGLRGRVVIYVVGGSVLLAFCGALAVLDAERANPEANITGFGDAIWWAVTTMTTVGYGDRYPTTGTGRLAATALMVGGITLLGVVTATFASWLIEQVAIHEQEEAADLRAEVADLHTKIDRLLARDV